MQEEPGHVDVFTAAMIDNIARIWTNTTISIIDVRHQHIDAGQPLEDYGLPSSMFIYTYGGAASVHLNHMAYHLERFGVFHAGKGTVLTIHPQTDRIQMFMILYKAEQLPFYKIEIQRMLEQVNPFVQLYGYVPDNPVWFVDLFQRLFDSWRRKLPLSHLHTKSLFYQLIHEVYRDLEQKEATFLQPDLVSAVKRYLDEHFMQPLLFQEIADIYGVSGGQLTRLFKKREGTSLQEYLTLKRLEAARYHLSETNGTVREIAIRCGLVDELNLIRMFKRHYKMTPSEYRKIAIALLHDLDIDNDSQRLYNGKGLDHLAKLQRDGEFIMFKQFKSKEMVLAAVMSLMLLLSACTSGTATNNSSTVSQNTTQTQTQTQSQQTNNTQEANNVVESQPRVIQTIKGEIEIPANPTRIVESGYWRGDMFALGVKPVATQNFYTEGNAYDEQMEGIEVLEKWEAENVMAMDPDIIITGSEEDFEKFSKVAPTIVIPWNTPAEERLPLIAQALGLDASEGMKLVDEYDAKAEVYRKTLEELGVLDKSITVFRTEGEEKMEVFPGYWGGEIVNKLYGMPMPEAVNKLNEGGYAEVSFEVLPELIGDYVLLNIDDEHLPLLEKSTVWNMIPAVQKGNVIAINPAAIFFPDIITSNYKLELISEALIDLAKKNK